MNENDRRLARLQRFVGEEGPRRERIGRYRLLELLGEGGAGVVFRARDEELGRDVALKTLKTAQAFSDDQVERFLREARTTARLRHPGIATVHESGRDGDTLYFTMELIPGRHFDPRGGTLHRRVEILSKVARAIQYAHEQGILHRDLKPGNILVDEEGRPRVLDFGLSRDAAGSDGLTRAGAVFGTPAYMAPEQAEGRSSVVGPPADVYSLGTLLYESLKGKVPFEGDSVRHVLNRVLTEEPPSPEGPPDLVAVVQKAMEKSPARRYPSAARMADDLDRFLLGEPTLARPRSPLRKASRYAARRWKAILLTALFCALAVSLFVATRGDQGDNVPAFVHSSTSNGRLNSGDGLKSDQETTVTYEDGSTLSLAPGASIRQGRGHIGMVYSRVSRHVTLLTGRYRLSVTRQQPQEPMAASTLHAAIYFQEGEYAIEVAPAWTRVETRTGSARVVALRGGPVAGVGAGQYAVVESGQDLVVRKRGDGLVQRDRPGDYDNLTLGMTALLMLRPAPPADEVLLEIRGGIHEESLSISRTRKGALRYQSARAPAVEIPGVFIPNEAHRIGLVHHPSGGVFVVRNGVAFGAGLAPLPPRPVSRSRMDAAASLSDFRVYKRALSDAEFARIDQEVAGPQKAADPGAGWIGSYYQGTTLSTLLLTRRDAEIHFDWGPESPDLSVGADRFSVRWTGRLLPLYTEPTTFHVIADDGVRLWINGKLVVDSWVDQVPTEFSATVDLTAGVPVDIRMEYFEQASSAQAKLFWSGPSLPKSCVPAGLMVSDRP